MRHEEKIICPLHSATDPVRDESSIVRDVFECKTCKWVKFKFKFNVHGSVHHINILLHIIPTRYTIH